MNSPLTTPSNEKQKNMLAFQLTNAHDGPYEKCWINREQLEEFKELNRADKIDKFNTSDLITILQRYNDSIYLKTKEEAAPLATACMATLNTMMQRIKGIL